MVFWISLAILVVAIIAGLTFCVIRGYQFYRQAKRSGAKITAEMDRISAVMAEIERHTAKAEAASKRLNAATGRLAVTRARLTYSSQRSVRHAPRCGALSGSSPASERRHGDSARNLHVSLTRSAIWPPKLTP